MKYLLKAAIVSAGVAAETVINLRWRTYVEGQEIYIEFQTLFKRRI